MANENMEEGATKNLENGTNSAQEVSSTTPIIEITKRSLRVQCWRKMQENRIGLSFNTIFNRIPRFLDADKAVENFISTDEFKNAKNIKMNLDRALQLAKVQTILAGKNLYLSARRDSQALYLKVDVPADATDEDKKDLLFAQDVPEHATEIDLENKVPLDIVLIGSVVVSRDGYRIGRGNGFIDLDIGLLIEVGAITKDTIIATMVHDLQVMDNLPTNLFQKYDTPVDLIITPKEIIRVENRLPRPTGIFWELLSERRLKLVPVLNKLREKLQSEGKEIAIKEYDTDIEQYQNKNRSRRRPMRPRYSRRNPQRRTQSQTDTEQQATENNTQPRRFNRGRPRRFANRRRRTTKSEGDQSAVEGGKSQEREQRKPGRNGTGNAGGGNNMRKQKPRKARVPQRDFCIKLSNLSRDVRVKDLKTELRRRECQPLFISWKAHFGKCYLHFGNRDGTASTDDDIDKVMKSLSDLSLTVNVLGNNNNNANANANSDVKEVGTGLEQTNQSDATPRTKTVNVNVELIKYKEGATTNGGGTDVAAGGDAADGGRIESVDTTTV